MSRSLKSLLLVGACVLASQALAPAQSGRRQPPQLSPVPTPTPAHVPRPTPVDTNGLERVRLVVSRGLDAFAADLNEQGRLGYRVEQAVGYGERGGGTYAAVLRLDPGHTYEYAQDRMPADMSYGQPLDYHARRGYSLVESFAVAQCPEPRYGERDPTEEILYNVLGPPKTNEFLFMRRDGAAEQTREYRHYTGYVGWRENIKETVQAAIDEAPPGFRPVRLLFDGPYFAAFGVSVVLERDLGERDPAKLKYHVVKEARDLVKEINQLAAEGGRYVVGGRIGPHKVALVAERGPGAGDYTFVDDNKSSEKRLGQLVAAGYTYQGLMGGDLNCDYADLVSQKLVFAREAAGPQRQYRILDIPEPKRGRPAPPALAELQRLTGEGFQIRDFFYSYGLKVLLEK